LSSIDELDHSNSKGPFVFLIAATNKPNALDIEFRRPGRFDKEIEIGKVKNGKQTFFLSS
jgi:SpoVK/Ycf46/Vps4 family AAA+-type ATPase